MKILLLLLVVVISVSVNNAQISNHLLKDKPSVYLTYEKSGERKSMIKQENESNQGIWLRLHNNTLKPIAVHANYYVDKVKITSIRLTNGTETKALTDGAEVELCYEAEAISVTTTRKTYDSQTKEYTITQGIPVEVAVPKQSPSYYSCKWNAGRRNQVSWIASGNSIVFSLPSEYLAENLKIYTLYNYEWEVENTTLESPGWIKRNEPYHQIFFSAFDIRYPSY